MGNNCQACTHISQDKEMEIQSNQKHQEVSIQDIAGDSLGQNYLELSNSIIHSKQSKRSSKLGLVIPKQIQQNIIDNVQLLHQPISENQKLIVKNALKKHFIFSQLLERQLQILLQKVPLCSAKVNSYIFRQQDKAGPYYIILEGQCDIEIKNQLKKKIKIGDTFGDLAIIYKTNRTASIKATKKCLLAMINEDIMNQVIEKINNSEQQDNLKLLQEAQVFKDFSQQFKTAIAANCLTQIYQEGQIVVNEGDSANSMYIIKKGTLFIADKHIQIGPKVCFGETCLIGGGTRSNTILCKTNAQIISISSSALHQILDSHGKNTLMIKLVQKIIKDSKIFEKRLDLSIQELIKTVSITAYKSGDLVINQSKKPQTAIYVTLGSSLQNKQVQEKIKPNTVLKSNHLAKQQEFTFKHPLYATKNGYLAKISMTTSRKRNQTLFKTKKIKKQCKSCQQQKNMQLKDLFYIKSLRPGNFAKVAVCYYPATNKFYAVKIMQLKKIEDQKLSQYVQNQQSILQDIQKHPFIINFHKTFKDSHNIYLIMDYVAGQDLFDFLSRISLINYCDIPFYLSQLVLILEHLHSHKIIFRDLKPQNLILNEDGYLVLVDFGSAKKLSLQKKYRTKTIIGTPHYMAPQIILGRGYSFNVDLWSLGVLLYQMMFCKLPFGQNCDDPFNIYEQVIKTKDIFFPKKCKDEARDLIIQLLNKKPQKRYSFAQIRQHELLKNVEWNRILEKKQIAPFLPSIELPKDKQAFIKKIISKQKNKFVEKIRKVFFSEKAKK